ncbi:MAG: hypothetical protein ACYTFO_10820 [Planctomycetota bacterium]|jgi:uncharacterized membrane protein
MTKRTRIIGLVVASVMVLVGIAGVSVYVLRNIDWLGTTRDESDFRSDAARIAFMQETLTVPIPPDATDIRLRYSEWMDMYLKASFRLPPASLEAFRSELAKHGPDGPNRWRVIHKKLLSHHETYELDPATGIVTALYMTE